MIDTEYTVLAAKSYNPNSALERQFIEASDGSDLARKLTQFVGLLQDKPLETKAKWKR